MVDSKFLDENNREIDDFARRRPGNKTNQINDIRPASSFRVRTFSNFNKSDAKKELLSQIRQGNIESSNYWCAEFVCAGSFGDIWDVILLYVSKYINVTNPKLPFYLNQRFLQFQDIVKERHFVLEIDLRNNDKIRKIFSEIVSTLAVSDKSAIPVEFSQSSSSSPLSLLLSTETETEADSLEYASAIFKEEDPQEIFVAINELGYNLIRGTSKNKNLSKALFWIDWLIDFDIACRKLKKECKCRYRENLLVDKAYKRDVVWVVWDCIMSACDKRIMSISAAKHTYVKRTLVALQNLFSINYRASTPKKRKALLFFALSFLLEEREGGGNQEEKRRDMIAVDKKRAVQIARDNVDLIYLQVKKNEVSPKTEYLFQDVRDARTDFEKTLEKMQLLNQQDEKSNHNSLL